MNDLIQTGFDYAALPVESVDRLKTWKTEIAAFTDTVESSLVQIGLRFQKAQDELNRQGVKGEGFAAWVESETKYSRALAYNLINVATRFKEQPRLNFGRSVLYALSAPSMPDSIIDKAIEKADSGAKVTVADVRDWKAELDAERQARERAESDVAQLNQRNADWREQSFNQRNKIRDLETQIDLLKAQPAQEPEKVIVAPDDYETTKAEAIKLRQQLADVETQKDKLIQQQVVAKIKEREQEIAALEHQAEQLKGTITSYQAHIARVHLPELEMQQQLKAVEDFMRACAGLAASLALFEHAPNPATTSVWQKGIAAATDAAQAMRMHTDRRPELTVIHGDTA